jgi:hypothetical protein
MAMNPNDPVDDVPAADHDDQLIDGHTIEELAEYVAAGRTPADPSIDSSPASRQAMANLLRLTELTDAGLLRQARQEPARDEEWIASLLSSIRLELDEGRDIPISHPDPVLRLTLSESSVRGLIRRLGDTTGGIVEGRSTLDGDVTEPGAIIRIELTCAIRFGLPIDDTLDAVRSRIRDGLLRHTELVVGEIDIIVDDVFPVREEPS